MRGVTPTHGPLLVVRGTDLTTQQFHDLLALRVQVFIVEQGDPYQAVDGVDLLPTTRHLWIDRAGAIASMIRLVVWTPEEGAAPVWRIGAVITAPEARGEGLAARLIGKALALTLAEHPERDVVLHAQAHLADWYRQFGFRVEGEEHMDGRIRHLWMRLPRAGRSIQ